MGVSSHVIVSTLVLAIAAVVSAQTFEGTYADSIEGGGYGGLLHICVDDGDLQGMYSEIGLMQGKVEGNAAAGQFYQGRVPGQRCTTGDFSLTLSSDGRGFRGFYSCSENPGELFDWVENKVNFTTPSDDRCGKIARSGVMEGNYVSAPSNTTIKEEVSVCTDDDGDEWRSSYFLDSDEDDDGTPGREEGSTDLDLRLVRGVYEQQEDYGTVMRWLRPGGGISSTKWQTAKGDTEPEFDFNAGNHLYRTESSRISDADDEDCDANVLVDFGEQSFFSYPLTSSSPASTVSGPFLVVFAIALLYTIQALAL